MSSFGFNLNFDDNFTELQGFQVQYADLDIQAGFSMKFNKTSNPMKTPKEFYQENRVSKKTKRKQ
jgi:hypothetical protein